MKTIELSPGIAMPALGFGVFQIPPAQTGQAVRDALAAGYRHIDTAQVYMNEAEVGQALAQSGLPRDEVFITSKVWLTNYRGTRASVERSLQKLGTGHLDLMLLHQPFGDVYAAWRELEELQAAGKIRAIGVSNFSPARLADLGLFNRILPQVNQIEINPFHQRPEQIRQLQAQNVAVQAWAPFAEGMDGIFTHPLLTPVAERHGKSVAQVITRWLLDQNITVLAKSVRPERMAENLDVFDFSLTDADRQAIATLDFGRSRIFDHDDPKSVQFLANYKVEGI